MDYQKIYDSLIEKRKKTPAKGYTENHHILPKSMGGSNDNSNLVKLTGREHWIAHLLLHKIHRLPQTAFACHMMAMMSEERGIPNIRNSHLYQKIRIECAKNVGQWTSKKGKANSQYGTMWICNLELKENKKITKGDEIPEGWIAGRNKWVEINKIKKRKIKKRKIKQDFENQYSEYHKIYEKYGWEKFCEITGYNFTQANLVQGFKRHLNFFNPTRGKKRK